MTDLGEGAKPLTGDAQATAPQSRGPVTPGPDAGQRIPGPDAGQIIPGPATGQIMPATPRPRLGIWLILSLPLLALALVFAFLLLSHQPLAAPGWLVARIEARANAALAGRATLRLGGAEVIVDEGFAPQIRLRQVQLAQGSGQALAVFPELRGTLHGQSLLRGRIEPKSLRIGGATVSLRRSAEGRLEIGLGPGGLGLTAAGASGSGASGVLSAASPADLSRAVEALFATPILARVADISAEDLRIRLDDARLGRVWEVSQGRFRLTQDAARIALTLAFDVGERDRLPAQVALSASTEKDGPGAEFGAAVTDVPAADLAVQSPALAMLGLFDAPISGTLRSGLDDSGALRRLDGTLHLGAGALRPAEGARPVPFDSADLRLAYDPARQAVTISSLAVQSRALRFGASGQVLLRDVVRGVPGSALVQMALRDIQADPEGLFVRPARIAEGAVDLRLRFAPFGIELGQLQLLEGARRITGRGAISAGPEGWRVAFDAGVNAIASDDLLALWPPALVPPTRRWLAENVATGQLRNLRAALRLAPGAEPRMELGYEFRGAEVTVLRTLPPVREGRGFAGITGQSHRLMVEEGTIEAPSGGAIEVADSVMIVPDIREKPARAEVRLVTRAPIPAALSLLDQKPFEFLRKAGRGTDIAEGWAEARTRLRFVMKKKITPEDVDFDVVARLSDLRSERAVPGHVLSARRLTLRADRAGMTISGGGEFDAIPFDGRWSQAFGPQHRGRSSVEGFVEITPEGMARLNIALPKGAVKGEGWGHLSLDLVKDQPPAYAFETDLKGLALTIPEIGWSKAGPAQGHLRLAGRLGKLPTVERLAGTAPGLSAEGRLTLSAQGFEAAEFDKLSVGKWFEGAVTLRGRGAGRAPDVELRGGRLDLRQARFGKTAQGGSGGGKIAARLDRLVLAEGLALAPLTGNFTTRGGLAGSFSARVNGKAAVEGAVGPAENGRTAVRLSGADAGAVLASAGIFSKARGGTLDLTLSPVAEKSYEGRVTIADLRVRDAPVLASMLSAASIIGLLEQLNGEGLLFSEVTGGFRLTPQGVSVTSGEAIGASMGVTMTGNYYPDTKVMDMQGVVTPFYLVNAIGQIFSRPGEGLFGFTYTLDGTSAAPKISINPLSIFTPGMFREIFRRAPPKVVTE